MKKGRILLMSPNLRGLQDGIIRIQPGLGIGYVAAVARQMGHEVFVRDTALEGYDKVSAIDDRTIGVGESDKDIADYISNVHPDVLGISVLFSNLIDSGHNIARIAKEVNPKIKVIIGGNHVSNASLDFIVAQDPTSGLPKRFPDIENKNVDYAMRGEVDFLSGELFDAIINERDPTNIDGLIFKKKEHTGPKVEGQKVIKLNNQESIFINKKTKVANLTSLPSPARDLMNMEGYFKIARFHSAKSKSDRVLNVMCSRGCPEHCTFCTTPEQFGQTVRWRDPQNIYNEIKWGIDNLKIGEVQFEDDSLTAHRVNLEKLCSLMEPLGILWCTPNGTKVNYQQVGGVEGGVFKKQLEMYKRMKASGCYSITLACESGSQRVLDKIIGKRLNLEDVAPAIEAAKKADLYVHTFWVVGFPGETREEMEQTIEFAKKTGADSYSLAILSPLPGTPIYHQVMREKLWWNQEDNLEHLMYRNSLVKVDGFKDGVEFQRWVDTKQKELNLLLKIKDPKKFEDNYSRGGRILIEDKNLLRQG